MFDLIRITNCAFGGLWDIHNNECRKAANNSNVRKQLHACCCVTGCNRSTVTFEHVWNSPTFVITGGALIKKCALVVMSPVPDRVNEIMSLSKVSNNLVNAKRSKCQPASTHNDRKPIVQSIILPLHPSIVYYIKNYAGNTYLELDTLLGHPNLPAT